MEDSWQILAKRMKELKARHDLMDESEKLANQEDFHLVSFDGKTYLDNVINVTGNYASTFADAVSSDLMSAHWQTVVEGDIPSRTAHNIEQFVDDGFEQIDEQLLNEFGITSLYAFHCNHVCVRSLIGAQLLSEVENGIYKITCTPIDMRWTGWQLGQWVAPIFFKNSDEFRDDKDFDVTKIIKNTDYVFVDHWTNNKHEIWIAKGDTYDPTTAKGDRIFQENNTLGYSPFVIVLPPTGFMLRGKGWIANESPDIFWLNRKLYKEANRSLSIEQTLGMEALRPAYERERENPTSEPSIPPPEAGESLDVRKGERHVPVPRGDLNRASLTGRQDILNQIQTGGISDAELGATSLDRPGIWFARQFEIRHKREKPLFEGLAMMKEGLARMMIKQFIESKESGELLVGRTGRRNKFSAQMLGDPDKYRISFKYNISSKEMEIVNLAQAQAARGTVPEKIIIRDILQAEDPDEWERLLELQKAKAANPAIGLLEMSVRYAEEAEELEDEGDKAIKVLQSKILLHDYVMMMRQRLNPQPTDGGGKEEQASKAMETKPNLQGLMSMPKMMGAGGLGRGTPTQEVTNE